MTLYHTVGLLPPRGSDSWENAKDVSNSLRPQTKRPGSAAKRIRANDHIRLRSCDRMSIVAPSPTSVYRYYDSDGLLLYVGITNRGLARNREHNDTKEWWSFVRRQAVDHFPTRSAALAREKALIRNHRPPFNKQHNPDHVGIRAVYLAHRNGLDGNGMGEAEGLSKKARSLLSLSEHRLTLTRHKADGEVCVVYKTDPKFFPLVAELEWSEGVILRHPTKSATLARIQLDEDGRRAYFVFRKASKGKSAPPKVTLKLRVGKHPIRAYMYEAVGA